MLSAFALSVAGCTALPPDIVTSRPVNGPYDRIAACVYSRLLESGEVAVTYADLKAERKAVIRSMNQAVPVYEATFSDGDGRTVFSVRAVSTVRGRDFWAKHLEPFVAACGA
jgi:hypothetical protein